MKMIIFVLLICIVLLCAGSVTLAVNSSCAAKHEKLWTIDIGQDGYEQTGACHAVMWRGESGYIVFQA